MKVNKIIEVIETQENCSCNACTKRHADIDKMHELRFGVNNRCNVIFLCTECLNEFSDKLWEYLGGCK